MQTYEVEIKSLLGSPERAQEIRDALKKVDPDCEVTSHNTQLNHYFEDGTLGKLAGVTAQHLSKQANVKLSEFVANAKEFSVRTREKDNSVLLVVKASVGDDTSANGVSRLEFEEQIPLGLDELDRLILSAGFQYQAKWSREREEYLCKGINVCLDKNAGYGYLAEFERVVQDAAEVESARKQLKEFMDSVGATELPQDRLERMFAFYNSHWPEYYGTDKIFTVE